MPIVRTALARARSISPSPRFPFFPPTPQPPPPPPPTPPPPPSLDAAGDFSAAEPSIAAASSIWGCPDLSRIETLRNDPYARALPTLPIVACSRQSDDDERGQGGRRRLRCSGLSAVKGIRSPGRAISRSCPPTRSCGHGRPCAISRSPSQKAENRELKAVNSFSHASPTSCGCRLMAIHLFRRRNLLDAYCASPVSAEQWRGTSTSSCCRNKPYRLRDGMIRRFCSMRTRAGTGKLSLNVACECSVRSPDRARRCSRSAGRAPPPDRVAAASGHPTCRRGGGGPRRPPPPHWLEPHRIVPGPTTPTSSTMPSSTRRGRRLCTRSARWSPIA
jgi:hypothetical protein